MKGTPNFGQVPAEARNLSFTESKSSLHHFLKCIFAAAVLAIGVVSQTSAHGQSTAARTLPANYTAGVAVAVSIAVAPAAATQAQAIEDTPPAAWTISNISNSGSFDAVNGKVKWGPFFDNTVRSLSYQATPPAGATGSKTFTGTASFDGLGITIAGNATISDTGGSSTATRALPANYTAGVAVAVSIAIAPAAATQAQAVEDMPPAGWTISNISNSGSFDAVNGKVKWGPFFDNTVRSLTYQAAPPAGTTGTKTFTGTASFDGLGVTIAGNSTISESAGSGTATRTLPANYTAGVAVAVSIAVAPAAATQAQAIEDTPPAAWTISNISNSGSFDAVNGKVKWGPFFDNTVRSLSYQATPPAGTTGAKTFTGTASFDGLGVTIAGNSTISDGALVPVSGTYFGLITSNSSVVGASGFVSANSGFIKLAVTPTTKFTGTMKYAGKTVKLRGDFRRQSTIQGTIRIPGHAPVTITLSGGPDTIQGSIQDGGITAAIQTDRNVFNKRTNPAPQAGKYTLLTAPTAPFVDQTSSPQGFGSGKVTVKRSGASKIVGKLGDGTKFSVGATISKFATTPIYAALYKTLGSVQGIATFQSIAGTSDADAVLDWFKPPRSGDLLYPAGFTTQLNFLVSRFAPPRGQRILQLPDSTGNLRITLTGGNIAAIQPFTVTLDRNNRVIGNGGVGFKVAINPKTGAFKGSFIDQSALKVRKFSGSIFQKQNVGTGTFKGSGQTGAVLLESSSALITPSAGSASGPESHSSTGAPPIERACNDRRREIDGDFHNLAFVAAEMRCADAGVARGLNLIAAIKI